MLLQEPPPNIAEFSKWLGFHLVKDWPMLLKAPTAFLAVLIFSIFIAWLLTWHVVIPQKNEQLSTKQSQIDYLTKQLDDARRENEKLTKQNVIVVESDRGKLKNLAIILASEIDEFAKNWPTNSQSSTGQMFWKFNSRFENRIGSIRDDLDTHGQHSEELDKDSNFLQSFQPLSFKPADAQNLAKIIRDLANNLKD